MDKNHPLSYEVFFAEFQKREKYIQELNKILTKYGLTKTISMDDLHFRDQYITDKDDDDCISKILSKNMWPPVHSGEFYHYTSKANADKIVDSKTIRLYTVKKRLHQGELIEFLNFFQFTHPLKINLSTMQQNYKSTIAPNIYYISLTNINPTNKEEKKFISNFGQGDASRLKLKIETTTGCLREISYGNSSIQKWRDLHKEICELTKTMLEKIFYWSDAAHACAFHLANGWKPEKETRLMINKSWGFQEFNDGKWEFIEMPINQAGHFNISIVDRKDFI